MTFYKNSNGMKKIFYLFLLCFTFVPLAYATEVSVKNAGFVATNIWYSKETFYSGETVRIYTIIYNGSSYDLSGTVEFLDNDTLLGKTDFELLGSGKVRDVSIAWKATEGKHAITARIVNASTSLNGGVKTPIILENAEGGKSDLTVEIDPAVVASQAKAEAARIAATGAQTVGQVQGALQTVTNSIPAPIKEGATVGVNAIESLRTALASQLLVAKEDKGKQIDTLNAKPAITTTASAKTKPGSGIMSAVSQRTEKPFAYAMYGTYALLQYFFQWQIIFYGALLYVVYRLIKWGISKFRNRGSRQ